MKEVKAIIQERPQPELLSFFVEGLAQARQEQKPIVLDFTADWCLPCQRMENEAFPDPAVATLLKRCIMLKVDLDEHPSLAQHFGVVGLPDIRLITPEGAEAGQLLDFQPPEKCSGRQFCKCWKARNTTPAVRWVLENGRFRRSLQTTSFSTRIRPRIRRT